MKKILYVIMSLVLAVIAYSCRDEVADLQPSEKTAESRQTHKLTPEEAVKRANQMLSQGGHTRSADKTYSVEYVTSGVNTRSGDLDTLLYVINYDNNEGFLIAPTDDRLLPVYAFSDEGEFNLAEARKTHVLDSYLNGVAYDVNKSIQMYDSMTLVDPEKMLLMRLQLNKRIYPKICEYQSKINQDDQYNDYCPYVNGRQAVAGCGPVAMEILLSHFQYPTTVDGIELPWSLMNIGKADKKIAKLLQILGSPNYMNANYTDTLTYTNQIANASTLRKLGFLKARSVSFSEESAERYLEKYPLLVRIENEEHGGHAFVIDGMDKYLNTVSLSTEPQYERYFHFVWGLSGICNGYYHLVNKNVTTKRPVYYWDFDQEYSNPLNANRMTHMIIGLEF